MTALGIILVLTGVGVFFPGGTGKGSIATSGDVIPLPEPEFKGTISVEDAIMKRRSVREYSKEDLTPEELSQVLWAAQGQTSKEGFRTTPSAGALYPLELYVVTEDGVFRYLPLDHSLEKVDDGDRRGDLAKAALNQDFVKEAPVDIVIFGVVERTRQKYGDRAERYVLMEGGHAAQNVYLQCESLGLGTVSVGAFYDDMVRDTVGVPAGYTPIYIMPVGHRK